MFGLALWRVIPYLAVSTRILSAKMFRHVNVNTCAEIFGSVNTVIVLQANMVVTNHSVV